MKKYNIPNYIRYKNDLIIKLKLIEDKAIEEFDVLQQQDSGDENPENGEDQDSGSDEDTEVGYRNAAYWSLPENVRHAIDLSKKKSKRSDFCN